MNQALLAGLIVGGPLVLAWIWTLYHLRKVARGIEEWSGDLAEPMAFDEFAQDVTLAGLGPQWEEAFDQIEQGKYNTERR